MSARADCRRNPPSRARGLATRIALALTAGLAALSAAQTPPASNPSPGASAAQAPAQPVEPPPQAPEATAPSADARRARASMALVLPLESANYARAADAVKAGFLAAAAAAAVEPPLVIGHGDGAVVAAFAKAKESGARVIAGPLVRDDLRSLVAAGADLPPTVALNQLDDGVPLPPNVFALALTLDGDARQLARRARADGAQSVVVIATDAPLQKRFAGAFVAEWILAGGGEPALVRFDRSLEALAALRRDLVKAPPDAALLALDGTDAVLVKPYLGPIPAYAGSQVNDRQPREMQRDLDGIRFLDVPWLVEADSAEFAGIARVRLANATLDRLYALGIDAFRVARRLTDGPPERLVLDGATGRITLDESRQLVREGRLFQFRAGEAVPVDR
jgi:hypothetical protein